MRLTLDHTQRLNLHMLIGAQRGTVDEVRAFWRLQDRINLSDEERTAINFQINKATGTPQWNLQGLEPVTYEFTDDDYARIKKIFSDWQPGFVANERLWLEPLLAQFDNSSQNGSH